MSGICAASAAANSRCTATSRSSTATVSCPPAVPHPLGQLPAEHVAIAARSARRAAICSRRLSTQSQARAARLAPPPPRAPGVRVAPQLTLAASKCASSRAGFESCAPRAVAPRVARAGDVPVSSWAPSSRSRVSSRALSSRSRASKRAPSSRACDSSRAPDSSRCASSCSLDARSWPARRTSCSSACACNCAPSSRPCASNRVPRSRTCVSRCATYSATRRNSLVVASRRAAASNSVTDGVVLERAVRALDVAQAAARSAWSEPATGRRPCPGHGDDEELVDARERVGGRSPRSRLPGRPRVDTASSVSWPIRSTVSTSSACRPAPVRSGVQLRSGRRNAGACDRAGRCRSAGSGPAAATRRTAACATFGTEISTRPPGASHAATRASSAAGIDEVLEDVEQQDRRRSRGAAGRPRRAYPDRPARARDAVLPRAPHARRIALDGRDVAARATARTRATEPSAAPRSSTRLPGGTASTANV